MGSCYSKQEPGSDGFDDGYLTPEQVGRIRSYSLSGRRQEVDHTNLGYTHNSECDLEQTTVKRLPSFVKSPEDEMQSRDKEIQNMVEVFQPCIEETVKVIDLLPYLHSFIDDEEAIRNRNSQREAVRCLIETLKASKEATGRWQAFMDALLAGGYPYLVRLLNGHTEVDHTTRRKLLKLFKPELIRSIDVDTCMDKLFERHVLHELDVQQIRCEKEKHGDTAACLLLLDSIPRRAENWFEVFVGVLGGIGLGHLADTFELGNIYVTPPRSMFRRCKMQTAARSDFSLHDSYPRRSTTPPPGYKDDDHITEVKKNEEKIRKLSERKYRKEKQLQQRTEIVELRSTIRDLDERLGLVPPPDDSSWELDMTSETGSCCKAEIQAQNASRSQESPPTCPKRYAHQLIYDVEYGNSLTVAGHVNTPNSVRENTYELKKVTEDLKTEISSFIKEQRRELSELTAVMKDLNNDTKRIKSDFAAHREILEDKLRQISETLHPPSPHNMHPVDSAFSDCSVVSITSF